jgi:hypothetical protein
VLRRSAAAQFCGAVLRRSSAAQFCGAVSAAPGPGPGPPAHRPG